MLGPMSPVVIKMVINIDTAVTRSCAVGTVHLKNVPNMYTAVVVNNVVDDDTTHEPWSN